MEHQAIPLLSRPIQARRKSGFTLVELLVVIVIIAVLAAVAIYATRGVRDKALQVKALNTMRQVGAASVSYASENNGDINVLLYEGEPRLTGGWVTKSFWGRLAPFLFSGVNVADNKASTSDIKQAMNALFSTNDCKKMTGTFQRGVQIYSDTSGLPVPFAFNNNVRKHPTDWKLYNKMSSFDTTQTIYFAYGFNTFTETKGTDYKPLPDNGKTTVAGVHYFKNKTAPFTFLDGHVEILSPPIPDRRFK